MEKVTMTITYKNGNKITEEVFKDTIGIGFEEHTLYYRSYTSGGWCICSTENMVSISTGSEEW